jgi:hypothetical protein
MELPLQVPKGHTGRVIVVISLDEGWDVSAEIDELVVPIRHCRDWHHVERIVTTIEAAFASDRGAAGVLPVTTD